MIYELNTRNGPNNVSGYQKVFHLSVSIVMRKREKQSFEIQLKLNLFKKIHYRTKLCTNTVYKIVECLKLFCGAAVKIEKNIHYYQHFILKLKVNI